MSIVYVAHTCEGEKLGSGGHGNVIQCGDGTHVIKESKVKYVTINGILYKRVAISEKKYLVEKAKERSRQVSFVSKHSIKGGEYIYYQYKSMVNAITM
uniref:Uncharacterized protein n=1 Tax=Pyramimonas orientalis virus TaxID=455367 RepID=A0A7M3UP48_POV01|nr:hypothetical protein HWQ62_00376 [Pyramimonas orientalis virus]